MTRQEGVRSRTFRALTGIFNDALYRGSLILLVNTAITSAIGFVFWALAARSYPASEVGVFSGVTSGVGLLAAVAALGLSNIMTRHVASAENQRELVAAAVLAIATVGAVVCLVTVLVLGPRLPASLHLQQRGGMLLLVTVLVVFTAVSGTIDAGLIALRSSHVVLVKNLVGSITKVAALLLLTGFGSSGLLISYGLGLVIATAMSSVALGRQIRGKGIGRSSFRLLRRYLSLTSANYLATVMGIMPSSVVTLEVLVVLGAAATARFAVAFLIAGFLNFIPSTVAQVLFAEASRQGVPLGRQLRKALRGVYALLLPALLIVVAAAPLILRLFGAAYAAEATGCLRVLALSTLLTGGTYLVDSLLIARDRAGAYVFINGANAALVLGCVAVLLPRGLTAAAVGWALGQALSLVLGLLLLARGTVGRHHSRLDPVLTGNAPRSRRSDLQPRRVIYAFEPQIRELLETWPMMPTTLIAEQVGWDQSTRILLDRVSELRRAHSLPRLPASQASYRPGEVAQCGFWFPPAEVPVGSGQTRSAKQLPVLTMITGYSRWLSAILIPSTQGGDLFTAWWQLLEELGSVPYVLTWHSEPAIGRWQVGQAEITGECLEFCHALGARVVIGRQADPGTRGLIERAHAHLEHSFLPGRAFDSPADFNNQLHDWLTTANTRRRREPGRSPAERITADRQAMLPLPPAPPASGWRMSMRVGNRPFIHFDSNDYSVHPAVMGRRVEVAANLNQVRVLCDGKLAAQHERIWARNRTQSDPAHVAVGFSRPGSGYAV